MNAMNTKDGSRAGRCLTELFCQDASKGGIVHFSRHIGRNRISFARALRDPFGKTTRLVELATGLLFLVRDLGIEPNEILLSTKSTSQFIPENVAPHATPMAYIFADILGPQFISIMSDRLQWPVVGTERGFASQDSMAYPILAVIGHCLIELDRNGVSATSALSVQILDPNKEGAEEFCSKKVSDGQLKDAV